MNSIKQEIELPEQPTSILRQLVQSNSEGFTYIDKNPPELRFVKPTGKIQYSEPRLVKDDLRTLVNLGLLFQKENSSDYEITRKGIEYIKEIDSKN